MMDLRGDGVQSELKTVSGSDALKTQRDEIYSAFVIPAETKARRQQRVRFLCLGERQNRDLVERLENCDRNHRCKSEAGPVCVTLFQRKLFRATNGLLAGRPWTRTTVVPSGLLVPYGHLGEYVVRK
jgi:hypothetical protein